VSWLHKYHIRIKKFREEFKNNVYTDEESVIGRHSINTDWRKETLKTPKQALLAELCTGLSHLQDDGHVLHQNMPKIRGGFIVNAKLVFLPPFTPKKTAGLAYDEINGNCYEKHFVEQLLGNISPGSVITAESAS
jgi:hypothetical protein